MPDLTPKQLEVLTFIQRFMDSGGLPPTRGEIAQGLQLKNRQGIDQHLRALATKGAIELIPGTSRGIRLRKALPPLSAQRSRSSDTPAGLPLLGRIAAGAPILATSNIEDYVSLDPALFRPRARFFAAGSRRQHEGCGHSRSRSAGRAPDEPGTQRADRRRTHR